MINQRQNSKINPLSLLTIAIKGIFELHKMDAWGRTKKSRTTLNVEKGDDWLNCLWSFFCSLPFLMLEEVFDLIKPRTK